MKHLPAGRRLLPASVLFLALAGGFTAWQARPLPHQHFESVHQLIRRIGHDKPAIFTGWRGGNDGHFPDATPPVHWTATENVAWKLPLPGAGNSTPVLIDDRLFVTVEPTTLMAVAAADGKVLWQREVTVLDALTGAERERVGALIADARAAEQRLADMGPEMERVRRWSRGDQAAQVADKLNALRAEQDGLQGRIDAAALYMAPHLQRVGSASATPVSDGRNVYALFGNFVVAAFTIDGELRWARQIPRRHYDYWEPTGQGASLLLVDGKLIVPLNHIRAFDAATGDELWTGDGADDELDYSTPAVVRVDGVPLLVTGDGYVLNAEDGETLAMDLAQINDTSPVAQGNDVLFLSGRPLHQPDSMARAVRLSSHLGQPLPFQTLWEQDLGKSERYSSPLILPGQVLVVRNDEVLTVFDERTGETLHERELVHQKTADARLVVGANVWSSPALAGKYIFVIDEDGNGFTLESTLPFNLVATSSLEPIHASPVFRGSNVYLRGQQNLYCIGPK